MRRGALPARKTAATGLERAQAAAAQKRQLGDVAVCRQRSAARPKATPEGEGELAVGEQGDHAGGEPERRPAGGLAPAVADEAVEEVGGGDDREHADQLRTPSSEASGGKRKL